MVILYQPPQIDINTDQRRNQLFDLTHMQRKVYKKGELKELNPWQPSQKFDNTELKQNTRQQICQFHSKHLKKASKSVVDKCKCFPGDFEQLLWKQQVMSGQHQMKVILGRLPGITKPLAFLTTDALVLKTHIINCHIVFFNICSLTPELKQPICQRHALERDHIYSFSHIR